MTIKARSFCLESSPSATFIMDLPEVAKRIATRSYMKTMDDSYIGSSYEEGTLSSQDHEGVNQASTTNSVSWLLALSVQCWIKSYVQWSPLGTYLATVHRQGVVVWGGASTFNQLMRYAHKEDLSDVRRL
ncbi:eukaryotic translation initiation factor 3 subunit B [Artemisia annua]|uniref:Eukaryotic translation initiation factor 3 subunit B n=1 Tax=Artemisia annua TaxID=35608 RepID=A0A2U1MDY0_ARTAN|nr:eukaryotic translation initiation factor 3 subunit B [Artemisia annua]